MAYSNRFASEVFQDNYDPTLPTDEVGTPGAPDDDDEKVVRIPEYGDGQFPIQDPDDGERVVRYPEYGDGQFPVQDPDDGEEPPKSPGTTPLYGNQDITASGYTSFNTNQQNDNRISFGNVSGEGNTVNPYVDNSITNNYTDNSDNSRYYGGSNRTFNYTGGSGESSLYDSPVSMATMGGYYDVDDSPAANAKFLDMYMDSNNIYQKANDKQYKETGTFDYESDRSRAFPKEAMMARIDESPGRSYRKSDKEMANLFGDIWGKAPPKWNMPAEPTAPDTDFEDDVEQFEDELD